HIIRGSVVSSIYHAKDTDNVEGAFFVFPDISVRVEGTYRLKFSLFEIVGSVVYFCKSVLSSPFTVYSAKKFPGMDPSTSLSQTFAKQGLKVRMRSENR
ncbi:velvet factor, partial [Dimargaris cristalligena]